MRNYEGHRLIMLAGWWAYFILSFYIDIDSMESVLRLGFVPELHTLVSCFSVAST